MRVDNKRLLKTMLTSAVLYGTIVTFIYFTFGPIVFGVSAFIMPVVLLVYWGTA